MRVRVVGRIRAAGQTTPVIRKREKKYKKKKKKKKKKKFLIYNIKNILKKKIIKIIK
jgi:hypothetical protein